MSVRILTGDCRALLGTMPSESVNCVVTSPPYWGLRDYGVGDAGIGLEPTLAAHLAALVGVFREVRRVLRKDGTLWLNYGDAYAGSWGAQSRGASPSDKSTLRGNGHIGGGPKQRQLSAAQIAAAPNLPANTGSLKRSGLKAKDLMGLPWRLAFALQDDGWWLRQDIIWSKPNPMPESVTDRCTKAHEYLFLLSKSARYYFDQAAILEPVSPNTNARLAQDVQNQVGSARAHAGAKTNGAMKAVAREVGVGGRARPRKAAPNGSGTKNNKSFDAAMAIMPLMRNKRSVWEVPSEGFSEAHFATFPPALIEPAILAGCPKGGVVLDPFGGAGTVGLIADRLQRKAILIELNPDYVAMAARRIRGDAPMFVDLAVA